MQRQTAIKAATKIEGLMKALLLLALRITTGALLIVWGFVKINTPEVAGKISDAFYFGVFSTESLIFPLGAAQIILGILVILGLARAIVYPIQALILVVGALAIWQHILDPLGLYLLDGKANKLFFPSSTVAVASLILMAFKNFDGIALDRLFDRR